MSEGDERRRLEAVAAPGRNADRRRSTGSPTPAAREPARELLELVLDLHGLALARIIAIVAARRTAARCSTAWPRIQQVRAILLLHGLHPEDGRRRASAQALDRLRPDWALRGIGVRLREVKGGDRAAASATARRQPSRSTPRPCGSEIEAAIVEAAPDLDDIVIEGLERAAIGSALRPTGELPCRRRMLSAATGSAVAAFRRRRRADRALRILPGRDSRRSTRT